MHKNEMKFHMLMFMNAWMMLVLMKCKCQMSCLTLGCYSNTGGSPMTRDGAIMEKALHN